jgi:hypothetical protein
MRFVCWLLETEEFWVPTFLLYATQTREWVFYLHPACWSQSYKRG